MARRRNVGSNGMLLVLAIHTFSRFLQLERKPPVTAALIAMNVAFYLRPGGLHDILPSLDEVCLNPYLVLRDLDVKRLFLSAFYHVDEAHLVYNMLSLLWKGVQLEGSMGSQKFAFMVAMLLGMSHGLMVVLSTAISALTDASIAYTCAVGFSSVLFALKVVLNHNSSSHVAIHGMVVPARLVAWVELFLSQMFVPDSSFVGHLSGILAGLVYVYGPQFFSSGIGGAIARWANWSWTVVTAPLRFILGRRSAVPPRRFGGGFVGSAGGEQGGGLRFQVWRCGACTFDNWEPADNCEMCGTPRFGSGGGNSSVSPSAPPWPQHEPLPGSPSASGEAMRQARIARFMR